MTSSTSGGLYHHNHPGPLTGRTLNELMRDLEQKWNNTEPLTPHERELLHRWRVGRLLEPPLTFR